MTGPLAPPRPRPGALARPGLRRAAGHRRAGAGRPAPPPRPLLRGAGRPRDGGGGHRAGACGGGGGDAPPLDGVGPPPGRTLQPLRLLHQLVRPDRRSATGVTDLASILDRAAETLRRRSMVFIVSDFLAEGWEAPLTRLAQRPEGIAVRPRGPRRG